MLAKRIIPCLDVKDGRTVKGINFEGLRDVGDAVALGSRYAREGADELVYLDISATREGRSTFTHLVTRIAEEIDIPFTVGGGISTLDDAARLLDAGADKVSINSAAIRTPHLIDEIARSMVRSSLSSPLTPSSLTAAGWPPHTEAAAPPTRNSSPGHTKHKSAEQVSCCSPR